MKTSTIADDKDDATNVMSNDFVLHHKLYMVGADGILKKTVDVSKNPNHSLKILHNKKNTHEIKFQIIHYELPIIVFSQIWGYFLMHKIFKIKCTKSIEIMF